MDYSCRSTLLLAGNKSFLARKSAAWFVHTLNETAVADCDRLRCESSRTSGSNRVAKRRGVWRDSRTIHTAKILRLSEDLPIVVEIVDEEEKIKSFLPEVDKLFEAAGCGGMITIEKAEVIRYSPGKD